MNFSFFCIALVIFYSLGSIPFGIIMAKVFKLSDIRTLGSGNIGATNVLRTGHKKAAFFTLVLDAGKVFVPLFFLSLYIKESYELYFCSCIALIGHIFPIWISFKGGKGVASALGSFLFFFPIQTLFALFIFAGIGFLTRTSSLSSLIAGLVLLGTNSLLLLINKLNRIDLLYTGIVFTLLLITHTPNIKRLIKGKESKINF